MLHALKYASDGFAVFPCRPGNKEPLGSLAPNGCLDATTDADTIRGWWTKCPNANIGIATGTKSGLSVIDLDGAEGVASGNRLRLSSNVTALTGDGRQLFYADTEGKLRNSVKKLAPGVDTRGEGGYVVAPPSLHPNGKRYAWLGQPLNRSRLSGIPSLFLTAPTSGTSVSTVRKADSWMSAALEELKKGHVHNTLISVLGKFLAHGFTEDDTFKLLQPYALENGQPFAGLRDKISEIWKRYPQSFIAGPSRSETIDTFLEDIKEPEWITQPFIANKSIGFIVGLPAVHKTWALMDLSIECARPSGSWFGLFPVRQSRVLFIDLERYKGETQRRFSAMIAAKGLTLPELKSNLYLKCGTTIRLDLQASFDAFRSELLELRPDIIMIDSFAAIHSSQENDRSAIQQVMEKIKALRQEIGCAIVMINHENKMAYPNGEPQGVPTMGTMLGSTGIAAAAEFIIIIRKVDDTTAIVHHVKSTLASSQQAFYFTTTDENGGTVVRGLGNV